MFRHSPLFAGPTDEGGGATPPAKINVGGKEYTPSQIQEALKIAEDQKGFQRANTQRAQELAQLRGDLSAAVGEIKALKEALPEMASRQVPYQDPEDGGSPSNQTPDFSGLIRRELGPMFDFVQQAKAEREQEQQRKALESYYSNVKSVAEQYGVHPDTLYRLALSDTGTPLEVHAYGLSNEAAETEQPTAPLTEEPQNRPGAGPGESPEVPSNDSLDPLQNPNVMPEDITKNFDKIMGEIEGRENVA